MPLRIPLIPKPLRLLLVINIAGFIFFVSIVTVPPSTPIDMVKPDLLPLDKWRHIAAYAAFGATLLYAWADSSLSRRSLVFLVFTITVLYGVGIEVGQSMIPQRYFSIGDAYANALGGILITPWYIVRPYLEFVPIGSWRYND